VHYKNSNIDLNCDYYFIWSYASILEIILYSFLLTLLLLIYIIDKSNIKIKIILIHSIHFCRISFSLIWICNIWIPCNLNGMGSFVWNLGPLAMYLIDIIFYFVQIFCEFTNMSESTLELDFKIIPLQCLTHSLDYTDLFLLIGIFNLNNDLKYYFDYISFFEPIYIILQYLGYCYITYHCKKNDRMKCVKKVKMEIKQKHPDLNLFIDYHNKNPDSLLDVFVDIENKNHYNLTSGQIKLSINNQNLGSNIWHYFFNKRCLCRKYKLNELLEEFSKIANMGIPDGIIERIIDNQKIVRDPVQIERDVLDIIEVSRIKRKKPNSISINRWGRYKTILYCSFKNVLMKSNIVDNCISKHIKQVEHNIFKINPFFKDELSLKKIKSNKIEFQQIEESTAFKTYNIETDGDLLKDNRASCTLTELTHKRVKNVYLPKIEVFSMDNSNFIYKKKNKKMKMENIKELVNNNNVFINSISSLNPIWDFEEISLNDFILNEILILTERGKEKETIKKIRRNLKFNFKVRESHKGNKTALKEIAKKVSLSIVRSLIQKSDLKYDIEEKDLVKLNKIINDDLDNKKSRVKIETKNLKVAEKDVIILKHKLRTINRNIKVCPNQTSYVKNGIARNNNTEKHLLIQKNLHQNTEYINNHKIIKKIEGRFFASNSKNVPNEINKKVLNFHEYFRFKKNRVRNNHCHIDNVLDYLPKSVLRFTNFNSLRHPKFFVSIKNGYNISEEDFRKILESDELENNEVRNIEESSKDNDDSFYSIFD